MILIDIFLIVFIISAFSFCIFVIKYLKRIFEDKNAIRKDIHMLVEKTIPILSNLKDITQRVNRIISEAEGYWEEINISIRNLREKILKFSSGEKSRDAQKQISEIRKNLRSITKGISGFWIEYKRK